MLQFAEMLDVRLFLLSDLLDGHFFGVELSQEDGALSSTSQPLQLGDLLERNLPHIYKPNQINAQRYQTSDQSKQGILSQLISLGHQINVKEEASFRFVPQKHKV